MPASVLKAASVDLPLDFLCGSLEAGVGECRPVLDSELESTQIDTPGYASDARGSSIDDDDNPFKNT